MSFESHPSLPYSFRRAAFLALVAGVFAVSCGDPTEPDPDGDTDNDVPVASVSLSTATTPMERTQTQTLTATTRDAANNVLTGRTVTWTSSAPTIASVDPSTGVITAVDRGTATITATSEGKTAQTSVEVIILYRSITNGDAFTCDLGSIGVAHCWGHNGFQDGRLGNGVLDNASLPDSPTQVNVAGTQRFTVISSGARHSCGLTAAGAAYCWGGNGDGQLGQPLSTSWAHQPVAVAGATGLVFTQISAGDAHTCALTGAGAAYCWGANDVGQLGNNTTTESTTPVAVSGGLTFTQISAGSSTGSISKTCGVAGGRGYCWGSDTYGELGDGGAISGQTTDFKKVPSQVSGPTNFQSISAGVFHVCGVLTTGAGYCWGRNSSGMLGNGSTDETGSSVPVALNTTVTFEKIEVGYTNSCGITASFALYCWGANVDGESGTAVQMGQIAYSPAQAATGEWIDVNLGTTNAHTCMIRRDRLSVSCMGNNNLGQLGSGAADNSKHQTPVLVSKQQP